MNTVLVLHYAELVDELLSVLIFKRIFVKAKYLLSYLPKERHNLQIEGSNPSPATLLDDSEKIRPLFFLDPATNRRTLDNFSFSNLHRSHF